MSTKKLPVLPIERDYNTKTAEQRMISEYYGEDTFNLQVMKGKLPKKTYEKLLKVIHEEEKLDPETANTVAHAMKEWALEKGATHYCHWFQPMTGATAEKHDAFIDYNYENEGEIIERFSGKQLVQGEPDASSFPSGGIRSTFEARGYTAWDITSPAFIMRNGKGITLCIPTAFISYTGEALDKKTPLLRSIRAVDKSAKKLLHVLGNKHIKKVYATLGAEQEYFLIDKDFYFKRQDLVMTGRTLLGNPPPRGQQLEDHYFGSIKERIQSYMVDVEEELYRLGIPAKTRHNEVAPSQFEIAPIFENANIAVDHNHLVMETLKTIARKHNLTALLHEKPFAEVNGSGKHLNWSLSDNEGNNLLNPGKTPQENIEFLVVLVGVIQSIYRHGDILRATVASAGNDHRLGANEAPPAILSIFLGEQLTKVVEDIEKGVLSKATDQAIYDLKVSTMPELSKDNTDRNRTSPFAFTGNKFEFRAVGSDMSISFPATVLNTIVAESLEEIADKISAKGGDTKQAAFDVMKEILAECKSVLFMGDNYSKAWEDEAAKRGLPNLKTTPEALRMLDTEKAQKLFSKFDVLSEVELKSRYTIKLERYAKQLDIEALSLYNMAISQIVPAAMTYQKELSLSIKAAMDVLGGSADIAAQKDILTKVTSLINAVKTEAETLLAKTKKAQELEENEQEMAEAFCKEVKPQMIKTRTAIDELEAIVDDEIWPVSKYWEMLFIS